MQPKQMQPRRKKMHVAESCYLGRSTYFLTLCTSQRAPLFRNADLVRESLALLKESADRYGFEIWAYCFMPDHLHLLAKGCRHDSDVLAFVGSFKQRAAFSFGGTAGTKARPYTSPAAESAAGTKARPYKLWQRNFYDHVLREGESWEAVGRYIWMNPVRKALCHRPEDWLFSGSFMVDWKEFIRLPGEWTPPWKPPRSAARPGLKPGPTIARRKRGETN